MGLAPNSAAFAFAASQGGMPRIELPGGRTIEDPHPEWQAHHVRWRWLVDSWEGGECYRQAVYGHDLSSLPVRNLIRHKREYPSPYEDSWSRQSGRPVGSDPATQAGDDDYELRRARTPVPTFVAEAVQAHLDKVFNREIDRPESNPAALVEWWEDVDGRGASIDQWMADTVAPLLMVLGQLDVLIDHPPAPKGEEVVSRADQSRLGLDRAVASVVLPDNVVWWRADRSDQFTECIVREVQDCGASFWRFWNTEGWALFDGDGKFLADPEAPAKTNAAAVLTPHRFGRVPIVRLFDRKRPRYRMVGLPRYEAVAELQREYYNRDSELILSDTTQAHPLLQGPEDFVQADGTIQIGPNWMLPKKKDASHGAVSYEGFDVIEFPKDGAESLRLNKQDLRDQADRIACLAKPAGAQGTTGSTVAQSGISKRLDSSAANELLGKIAKTLQKAEERIAELALTVLGGGPPKPAAVEQIEITYPSSFDLFTSEELADSIIQFQAAVAQAGRLPETEGELLGKLVRLLMPGLADDEYEAFDREIEEALKQRQEEIETAKEAAKESLLTGDQGEQSGEGGSDSANEVEPIDNADNDI